jgi:hypothetical protein
VTAVAPALFVAPEVAPEVEQSPQLVQEVKLDPKPVVEVVAAPAQVEASPASPIAAPSIPAPRPPTAASPGSGHDTSLAAERAILESARAAIAGGQASAGFTSLQQHAREFPRGRLAEEREGLWIRALIAAGRKGEARERLARFRKSFPKSMLLPAFEESLGVDSVTDRGASSQ